MYLSFYSSSENSSRAAVSLQYSAAPSCSQWNYFCSTFTAPTLVPTDRKDLCFVSTLTNNLVFYCIYWWHTEGKICFLNIPSDAGDGFTFALFCSHISKHTAVKTVSEKPALSQGRADTKRAAPPRAAGHISVSICPSAARVTSAGPTLLPPPREKTKDWKGCSDSAVSNSRWTLPGDRSCSTRWMIHGVSETVYWAESENKS